MMKSPDIIHIKRHFLLFSICILISSFFYFKNLDGWYLWQDEANTALLSKNILYFGYPQVHDGKNVIWPGVSDAAPNGTYWILWGWFPLYLNALIFKILGISTFTARFASALFGVFFVAYIFHSTRKISNSNIPAFLAALLIIFSITISLHVRQCGYYIFTIFFSYLIIYSLYLLKEKKIFLYIFSSLLLLNTHILIWGVIALFSTIYILCDSSLQRIKIIITNCICSIPFLVMYKFWILFERTGTPQTSEDFLSYPLRILYYIDSISITIMPLSLICVFFIIFVLLRKNFDKNIDRFIHISFLLSFLTILLIPLLTRFIFLRYILFIFPLLIISLVFISTETFKINKVLGSCLLTTLIIFAGLNYRQSLDKSFYSQLPQFIYELTHKEIDANKAICNYLNQNAKPNNTILCNYEDFPIIFYTGLKVRGGPGGIGLANNYQNKVLKTPVVEKPDWIIVRKGWSHLYKKEIQKIINSHEYEEIILPYEDTFWGNRESPFEHFFAQPILQTPIKILKLKHEK